MNHFTSLRSRLIVVYVGLMVLGFGSLTVWSAQQVYTSTFADYGNTLNIYTLLLASQLEEPLEYGQTAQASAIMVSSAEDIQGQIALFSRNGEFLLSSDLRPTSLVKSDGYVISNGQVIATTDILHDAEIVGTIQISTSTEIPFANVRQRWIALGAGFVLFSILSLLVTLRLINAMTQPLDSLRANALRIAEGDLSRRMTDLPNDEIGAVGRAFNTMIERVIALLHEQRAFASNASHELRTPLTTIRLRTEALQSGGVEPELEAQYIKEIDSEATRLGKLVDDLLLLSRLDAKRMEVGKEQIDCVRMVETLERQYGRVAQQKQIVLQVFKPADSLLVKASLSHLQIVFRNVIDNALKYTPGSGVVRVILDTQEDFAVLTVEDNGRGIDPDNLPQIGKRFYRTDKSRNRRTAGTGLGLSLVASILELYNGSLNIHSDGVDQGTVVTVRWPLMTA